MNDGNLSGLDSDLDGLSSEGNSSIDIPDSDALRLDTPEATSVPQKQLFYQDDEDSRIVESVPLIHSPVRKRVRFNKKQKAELESDGETPLHPWEFKRVIRRSFRDKLPNNYQIKRWKRPSNTMVGAVVQLLETNVESALQQVLDKYKGELQKIDGQRPIDRVFRQKQSIMNDIVSKIKSQLKKSRFPSRISDRDLEIEYIVSKRKFIQKRYAEELNNAERLEGELLREQRLLDEVRESCKTVQEDNRTRLTEGLIGGNNLHPSLNKAMENAYGLITDSSSTHTSAKFERDIADLNLKTTESENVQPSALLQNDKAIDLLPAFKDYQEAARELQQNMAMFESPQLAVLKEELLPRERDK